MTCTHAIKKAKKVDKYTSNKVHMHKKPLVVVESSSFG